MSKLGVLLWLIVYWLFLPLWKQAPLSSKNTVKVAVVVVGISSNSNGSSSSSSSKSHNSTF